MRTALAASLVVLLTTAGLTSAATIRLFNQTYRVERIDYFEAFTFPNPNPAQLPFWPEVSMFEVEGSRYIGNNRMLLASEKMSVVSYKTIGVEVELDIDPLGLAPTQIDFVRVVFWQDPPLPPNPGYDMSPSGLTINTGATGLGAGGNLVISDTENQVIHAYNFTTGQRIPWPQTPAVPPTNPAWDGWSVRPSADEPEDIVYVAGPDRFYIVQEDEDLVFGGYRIAIFETNGTFVSSFPVAGSPTGGPKGLEYLPDLDTYPCALRSPGGSLLLSWDDAGPGLEAFSLDGAPLAFTTLPSAPPLDPGTQDLAIESLSSDPLTGRLFLVQQGDVTDNNYLYILSPVWGDLDGNGAASFADAALLLSCVAGPESGGAGACEAGRVDCDADVDLADVALFQSRYRPA